VTLQRLIGCAAVGGLLLVPAAASAGTGDYSSGQGLWSSSSNSPGQAGDRANFSVGWEAFEGALADGQFDIRNQQTGEGFHARVVCLEVAGNVALFGLVADDGTEYEAYAEDNTNGSGGLRPGAQDRFHLEPEDANCEDSDDDSDQAKPIYGDVFNHDSGA
jgi:hypothetical protein